MYIGHINLAKSFDSTGERFITLVETLQQLGTKQYVVVRNVGIAKRLNYVTNVIVGPTVRSSVSAQCLIPRVDIVHVHGISGWQAGLLLILTKSIPFVLTSVKHESRMRNAIMQAAFDRASAVIPEEVTDAADILLVYRRAVEPLRVPTMLL